MKMKAVLYTEYGPPDVLKLTEVEKPVPLDNEVLIQIHAASVTFAELGFRAGKPYLARLSSGFLKPKRPNLGVELAGITESVGKDVKMFKEGDQVFGYCGSGAHAEYTCMPEDGVLAKKPANMSFEEAAVSCDGLLTALPFLRDKGNVQSGQDVLINGASGSIGTFAVQLAKYYGAAVTGVCSTSNLELVTSLGADNVIDYTKEDFTRTGQTYDIIFDTVAKSSFSRCKGSLEQNGVYLTTFPTLSGILPNIGSRKAIFHAAGLRKPSEKRRDLIFLKGLMEAGKIRSVIDRSYPLEKVNEAHRYVEKGHKKGNVVITVVHNR
jgi:NADPH:quinone reductase-like Zn-dependent oxidoreductase